MVSKGRHCWVLFYQSAGGAYNFFSRSCRNAGGRAASLGGFARLGSRRRPQVPRPSSQNVRSLSSEETPFGFGIFEGCTAEASDEEDDSTHEELAVQAIEDVEEREATEGISKMLETREDVFVSRFLYGDGSWTPSPLNIRIPLTALRISPSVPAKLFKEDDGQFHSQKPQPSFNKPSQSGPSSSTTNTAQSTTFLLTRHRGGDLLLHLQEPRTPHRQPHTSPRKRTSGGARNLGRPTWGRGQGGEGATAPGCRRLGAEKGER